MNADQHILVARVQMPERGQFLVRVEDGLVQDGIVTADTTGRFVVALDYGEDVGCVVCVEPYDPQRHGTKLPRFRLVRPLAGQDERIVSDNMKLAEVMRTALLGKVRNAPDLRIAFVRLSFGQKRLFVKYVSDSAKPDFSDAQDSLKSLYGVDVSIRAIGPRDEIAEFGGLGPCGRVCCCCSWQKRFPQRISPGRCAASVMSMNGTCGRFKCCLAFERDGQ